MNHHDHPQGGKGPALVRPAPDQPTERPMTRLLVVDDEDLIRRRQRGRALVVALLLAGLVVLIFAITLAKIRQGIPE